MSKGKYDVQNRRRQSIDDTSWKSCTCALLIISTFCLLILLLTWNWRHPQNGHQFENKRESIKNDAEGLNGDAESFDVSNTKKYDDLEMLPDDKFTTYTYNKKELVTSETKNSITTDSSYYYPDLTKNTPLNKIDTTTFLSNVESEIPPLATKENFETSTEIDKVTHFTPYTEEITDKVTVNIDDKITDFKSVYDTTESSTLSEIHTIDSLDDLSTLSDIFTNPELTTEMSDYTFTSTDTLTESVSHSKTYKSSTDKISDYSFTSTDSLTESVSHSKTYKSYTDKISKESTESVTTESPKKGTRMYAGIPVTIPSTSTEKEIETIYTSSSLFKAKDICDSVICKDEASNMLSLISRDANVCQNLYEFACQGMLNPQVTEMDLESDVWKRIEGQLYEIDPLSPDYLKKFKSYYTSCMEHDPDLNLDTKSYFKAQLSGLASFYDKTVTRLPPTCKIITDLLKRNFVTLFDLTIDVSKTERKIDLALIPSTYDSILETFMEDNAYSEKCLLQQKSIDRTIDLDEIYTKYKKCTYNLDSYMRTTKLALEYADAFSETDNPNQYINETLETLKSFILTPLQMYGPRPSDVITAVEINDSKYMKVDDLRTKMDGLINIDFVFQSILDHLLDDDDEIQVYFFENFENVMKNIPFNETRKIHNAIFAMYTQSVFKDFILTKNKPYDRHKICLKTATKLLVDVTSSMYLKSFDDKEIELTNQFVINTFDEINSTLEADLQHGNILVDVSDKSKAAKIAATIYLYTIHKNRPWTNEKFLLDRSSNISLTSNFMVDTIHLQQVNRMLMYNQYKNDAMLSEIIWTYVKLPYDTKISIIKNLNTIIIPMGAIQHFKTHADMPKYLTMADLGFKLAKEIFIQMETNNIKVFTNNRESSSKDLIVTDLISNQNFKFKQNSSNSFSIDILTDLTAAGLAYSVSQRHSKIGTKKDFPLLWLNKSWAELYFIRLSQNFCTKQPLSNTWIKMFIRGSVYPQVKVNTIAVNSEKILETFNCKSKIMANAFEFEDELDDTDFTPDT